MGSGAISSIRVHQAIRPFASPTGVDQEQLRLHLKVESGTLVSCFFQEIMFDIFLI